MKGDGEETLQTIGLCRLCAHQLFHSMTHTAHKPAGQPDVILTVRTTQIPMDNRTLSLQFGQPKSRWTTGHFHYSSDNPKPTGQPDIIPTARTNQACLTTG